MSDRGGIGPASPIVRWIVLFAGIVLVVFGPDSPLGLAGLAAGLALVVASLAWWMRSEARRP